MKRSLLAFCILVVIGIVGYSLRKSPDTSGPIEHDSTKITESPESPAREPSPQLLRTPVHPLAVSFGSTNIPVQKEPEILLEMLQAWRRQTGKFPVAEDNRQLVRKLMGNNEAGIRLFPAEHIRISPTGELIDGWGAPFIFHHISSQYLEIRSAGPDRETYTADDIVVPSQPPPY